MADALKHVDVTAGRITENQYEAETQHELESGVDGEFIYWDTASSSFKRIAHQTDLDAHTRNPLEIVMTGEYYVGFGTGGTTATMALVADKLYGIPIQIVRNMTADRIAIEVRIAGAGGTKARLGIYNNGANLYPGSLLLDAGEVAVDAAAIKTIVINQALTKGLYWLAVVSDGAPTVAVLYSVMSLIGLRATLWENIVAMWRAAFVYAALPDPFTAGGDAPSQYYPVVPLRIASLD